MVRMGLQLMVVDTVIKPNRNSVATSLGYEFQGQDKDDDIDYVKEVLVYYIEEVEHIIVIRALRWTSFMDCFVRVFDLDAMNSLLWFHGDYSKILEREAKDLKTAGSIMVFVESEGIVIET
ncbi:unnamed protein product [Rhizophagus irregularis]|uniref:Uncharacterized protein n=1 Tax=Rhizophagus irregularis TaxID=588596 RepID=A0A2I1H2G6_9GLOM|nr:hypothetical protein RhiirA4_471110 [Rhizophagus irregularis]CAB4420359.1 unnamed protein product [Rhizophagus irregularis]